MSTNVAPIENLVPIQNLTPLAASTPSKDVEESVLGEVGESIFGSIFKNAIQNVKGTDAEFSQAQYLLSTGQLDNPATALIAYTKEEVAVNLLIQLRNRAMDAYSELTRMSF